MTDDNIGNGKERVVLGYLFEKSERLSGIIEDLNRSSIINNGDRALLFAIKRNIEFGMDQQELVKRMIEIGRRSPKLIALLIAAGIYRFYDNC